MLGVSGHVMVKGVDNMRVGQDECDILKKRVNLKKL